MAIAYAVNARPTADEVRELTLAVGWRDPALHGLDVVQRVWDEAPCTVLAREDGRLVGMCRAMWDGGIMAVIKNVVVHPDRQGQGIGSELMRLLLAQLEELAVAHVSLDAAAGKEAFYEKFGFEARPVVTPMIKHRVANTCRKDECCDE